MSKFEINKAIKNKCMISLLISIVLFSICMIITPVYTNVKITFAENPYGESVATVFSGYGKAVKIEDAKSRVVNGNTASISYFEFLYKNNVAIKRIDPIDNVYEHGSLTIEKIEIKQNGIKTISISGDEIQKNFIGNEDLSLLSDKEFTFDVVGSDPQMISTEDFINKYCDVPFGVAVLGWFYLETFLLIGLVFVYWFIKQINDSSLYMKIFYTISALGIIFAVLSTIYVGLRSPFWLNPDEYDVRSAVRYYFTHFMPPDIRSDAIADSFPVYGTSRHFEFNVFYFLAGKLGCLFSDPTVQIRLFSLIIFCIMAIIIMRDMKKNYAFVFVLLLTPQLWYIFSYATSDALDFFVGFLCIYQLVDKESLLNKILNEEFNKKHLIYYFLIGFLFVNVFWSKASFYTLLVFIFLILLIRLIYESKENRKELLKKYLILLGITIGIFFIRYMVTDFRYYGFDKLKTIVDVTELRADYGYKPSTPPLLQAGSMSFFGKGITLKELLTQYKFNETTLKTFAGLFGTYRFGARNWYYYLMWMLYVILFVRICCCIIKERDKKKILELISVGVVCVLQYFLIIFNSWFIDFQPQGRYLLPIVLFITYIISRIEKRDKIISGVLICTCILSLYCFVCIGIPNLVPNYVNL